HAVAAAPAPAHARTGATTRRTPTPAGGRRKTKAEPIPRFVEFRPGNALRYVFGTLFTIFSVGAVIGIFWAVSEGGGQAVLGAAGLTALAMASWWALLNWSPAIISISNGLLEVSRGSSTESWDLRDPDTEITYRGRVTSRSWRAVLRNDDGKPVTISASNVDASQFTEIVAHYQALGPEGDDA
ncbi:MAG TPA: hypothetical protein VGE14_00815, partial [Marmoricola sp.]